MSGNILFGLVAGLAIGAFGSYLLTLDKVEVARRYQVVSEKKSIELAKENTSIQRRINALEDSVYDRQKIRECVVTSNLLSDAIKSHLQGKAQSSAEKNILMRYMSNVLVATQGRSRNSAMSILWDEKYRVIEECLDSARVKVAK